MSKIFFDAPEDWEMSYKVEDEDHQDEEGNVFESVFTEFLFASSRDGKESFEVCIPHDYVPVDILEDIMLPELADYLSNSDYIIHDDLNFEQLVNTCQICGQEAYYYLIQNPDDESADLRIMFCNSEGYLVFINARLYSWKDDDRMISFLAEHLSFR